MPAYKFLARGAVGIFTGVSWPVPRGAEAAAWVAVDGPLDACRRGLHVCRANELAHWLHDELWEVEVDGEQLEGIDCLVVERARLVRRIEGWDRAGAERFAAACLDHASMQLGAGAAPEVAAMLDDAALALRHGYPAIAAYQAAVAIARHATDLEAAYASERGWQSAWICRELIAP